MPWTQSETCKRGHPWTPETTYTPPEYAASGRKQNRTCKICRDTLRNESRKRNRLWFQEYKKTLKCGRCPENHPACLSFHHRDPSKKEFKVSGKMAQGLDIAKLVTEIAKCDVLCANCHAKEHYYYKE